MAKRWKIAFYSVLALFAAFIITLTCLYYYYLPSVTESELTLDDDRDLGQPMFTVSTSKQQLTRLINEQLEEYEQKKSLNLQVELEEDIILKGTINFFGSDIAFEMRFRPAARANGDLVLVEEAFRLGRIQLPEDKVLEFIKNGTSLPEWVQVMPDKEKIYIALTEITLEDQFYLKAKHINLKENVIKFSVYQIPQS